ncbi:MAG: cytochrome c-type biogenesis protein CcmH [bacterium]
MLAGLFSSRRRALVAAMCVAAIALFVAARAEAQSAQTSLTDRGQVYLFREVSEALVCQCGCNMILYVCNHVNCPSAYPFRDSIEVMIQAGKTKEQIVAKFVADHGEVVLSAPTTDGFNLAAWVTPFVMLVLGGAYLGSFLRARKRRAALQAAAVAASAPGGRRDSYTERVDEELDRFRG